MGIWKLLSSIILASATAISTSLATFESEAHETKPVSQEFTTRLKTMRLFNTNIYSLEIDLRKTKLDILTANSKQDFSSKKFMWKLKKLSKMVSDYEKYLDKNVLAAVNGSFFDQYYSRPVGDVVDNNKRHIHSVMLRSLVTYDGKTLRFGYAKHFKNLAGFEFVVAGGPRLVTEGKLAYEGESIALKSAREERFKANMFAKNPRTAIGQTKDGKAIFMVTDGRTSYSTGLTFKEEAEVMKQLGAFNAINLDGGGSSELILSGEYFPNLNLENEKIYNFIKNHLNGGERFIANGIAAIEIPELPQKHLTK